MSNEWNKLPNPPAPLFLGKKERDLVKQVTDELIERVIGQQIVYFPISIEHSNYHPLYGESIEKTFLSPIRIYCLVEWEGTTTETSNGVVDRRNSLFVHFHNRRLVEDQDLFVNEGDFIKYGEEYYEIVEIGKPRLTFGQVEHKVEITAKCIKSRQDLFAE